MKLQLYYWQNDADSNPNDGKHICRSCKLKTDNPAKRADVQAKIKKTVEEKYGGVLPINTPEQIAKRKEQFKDQGFVEQVLEKRKETCLEKYGVDHHMKSEVGKEAVKAAMQEKYGVDYPLQSEEVKEKMRQTCQERYGVDNIMDVPEVKSKVAQTMMDRYGVERYNQLPEMKDYLRDNCREWLRESWENPWAKGITRPEEWNHKQSETMAQKIIRGEFSPEDPRFFYTGWYNSSKCKKSRAFYRSSLELIMHYIIDSDDNVLWYENEPFAIPYEKENGVYRNYIPDFFVFLKIGLPRIYEIKPSFRMREQEVKNKVEAANIFCNKKNIEFIYVDEKFLNSKNIELEFLLNLPQVESLKK